MNKACGWCCTVSGTLHAAPERSGMQIRSGAFTHDSPGPAALERPAQGHMLAYGELLGT